MRGTLAGMRCEHCGSVLSARFGIERLLSALLSGGPVAARECIEKAVEEGASMKTVRRAKKRLGVSSLKVRHLWYWSLPAA